MGSINGAIESLAQGLALLGARLGEHRDQRVLVDTCPQDLKAAIKLLLARLYQLGSPEPLDLKLISPAAGALLDFYSNYNFSYRPA